MSANSAIEWTQRTWNPVTGCTEVSPGCDHCYAKTFAERFRGVPGHAFERGFDLTLRPERLQDPFRWRKPERVFVNSMSDLFHKDVPDEFIAQVFATMTFAGHHSFQVLTKRPDRMRHLLPKLADGRVLGKALSLDVRVRGDHAVTEQVGAHVVSHAWPAKNVWLGVSIESNDYAWRADMLRETPAAVRWISAEPLLGPLDKVNLTGINWVVVGGESGRGARPMHPQWARDLRDRCVAAGIPFFFKQWGQWSPHPHPPVPGTHTAAGIFLRPDGVWGSQGEWWAGGAQAMDLVKAKKAAGRELDGRTWDEYPTIGAAA